MLDLAATADVAYPHIVRGIKKGHLGAVATHQPAQVIGFPGIAAQQPVRTQLPEIARLRDHRPRQQSRVKVVEAIRTILPKSVRTASISAGSKPVTVMSSPSSSK